jgi:hypothetical protein
MNNMKLIMENWRTNILLEKVYGAQAIVYHGSETPPDIMIPRLANDEFIPGQGGGAMYGKGIYTVYDENPESNTFDGGYGDYVYKLKVNLHGYIIFDQDITEKVYGKKMSPMEQLKMLGHDDVISRFEKEVDEFYNDPERVEKYGTEKYDPWGAIAGLRRGEDPKKYRSFFSNGVAGFIYRFFVSRPPIKSKNIEPAQQEEGQKLWTSTDAHKASELLSQSVKGVVFTGRNDGKVAIAYDPGTVVPVAWCYSKRPLELGAVPNASEEYKNFPVWRSADRESIKKALSRTLQDKPMGKDYIPGRYNPSNMTKKAAE